MTASVGILGRIGIKSSAGPNSGNNGQPPYVGRFGLAEWWSTAFSVTERELLDSMLRSLVTSDSKGPSFQSAAGLLAALAGCLIDRPHDRSLVTRILAKAQERARAEEDILGLHFTYHAAILIYYRWRDQFDDALDLTFGACHKQISLTPKAAKAFHEAFPDQPLPPHIGFQQMATILEKQGLYTQAIDVCKRADAEGWDGNWSWRIQRMAKEQSKHDPPLKWISPSGLRNLTP